MFIQRFSYERFSLRVRQIVGRILVFIPVKVSRRWAPVDFSYHVFIRKFSFVVLIIAAFLVSFLEVEDDLTSINEQEQDMSQDRNTSKRRYSRLSDGYERLKTVLPSVKDKRRVSKVMVYSYLNPYDIFWTDAFTLSICV